MLNKCYLPYYSVCLFSPLIRIINHHLISVWLINIDITARVKTSDKGLVTRSSKKTGKLFRVAMIAWR